MYQPFFGRLSQNLARFLLSDFAPQIVLHDVAGKPVKMETDLGRVLAVGKLRILVLTTSTWAVGDSEVLMGFQHLDYFFIGKNLACVLTGRLNG
jgi:hypothetical protein